jgi:hypothetical protein
MIRGSNSEKNIKVLLDNYQARELFVRPFSLSYNKMCAYAKIVDGNIAFLFDKERLNIIINNNVELKFEYKKDKEIFKIEYERYLDGSRWYKPDYINPNLEGIPIPKKSVLRNVIEGYLVEIEFDGHVKIIEDQKIVNKNSIADYWKIVSSKNLK